jgi:hypothetical protein
MYEAISFVKTWTLIFVNGTNDVSVVCVQWLLRGQTVWENDVITGISHAVAWAGMWVDRVPKVTFALRCPYIYVYIYIYTHMQSNCRYKTLTETGMCLQILVKPLNVNLKKIRPAIVELLHPTVTELRGRVVNNPALYSWDPWFKSWPEGRISWLRILVVLLSPSRKMPGYYLIRPRPLPSIILSNSSFIIHLSFFHSTLCGLSYHERFVK